MEMGVKSKKEEFLKLINKLFNKNDKAEIVNALELMIELHKQQKDRANGDPYIFHPVDVATRILVEFKIINRDLIVAALLHDSVEDQVEKIVKKFLGEESSNNRNDVNRNRELGFLYIEEQFGKKVSIILKGVTNPMVNTEDREEKNLLYKQHISEAIKIPGVFVVKYADFVENALHIHELIVESKKRLKLEKKYGPVLKDVFIPAFKKMEVEHPLFCIKDDLLKEAEKYYNQYYLNN